MRKNQKFRNTKEAIKEHIRNNSKEYFVVCLLFIIGIFLGVLFVNKMQQDTLEEGKNYLNAFVEKYKTIENTNSVEILKNSIKQNILLAVIIWFFGTTVIGMPVVFGMVLYRGFSFGYTISLSIVTLGFSKGLAFVLTSLLLQSILLIPAILALAVSGFKLYKSIIKDKRKENIKLEIIRHTFFSLIMTFVLIISSLLEAFVSMNGLKLLVKYL